MRKNQLREYVDNQLRHDHTRSYQDRKYRHFVLHKIIRDLYHIDFVPGKWHGLNREHIQRLVSHWKSEHLKPSTIMKYMTVLRYFLNKIDHMIPDIDNPKLGVINQKVPKKSTHFPTNSFNQFSNPIATLLFQFQVHFGLTLSEAMRLTPDIHIQKSHVWITRDIASNSLDRLIPIRYTDQSQLLGSLATRCNPSQNLIATLGYHHIRYAYSIQLKFLGLPSSKSWRYLYAKRLHQELRPILSNYLVNQTIMREMGIKTRMTLWRYLNEQD